MFDWKKKMKKKNSPLTRIHVTPVPEYIPGELALRSTHTEFVLKLG